MGSVPRHPFFLRVIQSLQQYDHRWLLPYITVMYSTGPLFLSVVWKEYIQDSHSEMTSVRILMQDEYMNHSWSFFTHHTGSSWHGKDAPFIFWVSYSDTPGHFLNAYNHRWADTGCTSPSAASSSLPSSASASSGLIDE